MRFAPAVAVALAACSGSRHHEPVEQHRPVAEACAPTSTTDMCLTDADCAERGACACNVFGWGGRRGNRCVGGDCRIDADCGPGGACSLTMGACGYPSGYYCHTPSDLCSNDRECLFEDASIPGGCRFLIELGYWKCAGPPGCRG